MFTSNLNILYNLNLHLVPNYNKLKLFDENALKKNRKFLATK